MKRQTFKCKTTTGSTYTVTRDEEGAFWLEAKNVPHRHAVAIPRGVFPIDLASPWPPKPDERLHIYARVAAGHDLLPQASYITSSIESVTEVR